MDRIEYPVPQPMPPLAVRRLSLDDAAQIAALYRAGGRDGAWCGEDTVRALFRMGAVWWGGFAGGALALCAASAASTADTPQATALRGALAPGAGRPPYLPECFLLPPALSQQGEVLAGALLPLLMGQLALTVNGAARPKKNETAPALLAALPVKAPAPLLAAYFAAGFAAVCMRPLVSLRPHYLLQRYGTQEQLAESGVLSPQGETNAPTGTEAQKETGTVRRVYLPLADTLAVSRLLEQGFCATALCRSSADERTLIRLER